jgi:hypothetical protein
MGHLLEGKRYIAVAGDVYQGAPEVAVISPLDGHVTVLSRTLACVFEQCAIPRAPADHAIQVSKALGLSSADATAALGVLAAARLLIEDPTDEMASSTNRGPIATRIETAGIVTADRPDALRRALNSYLQNWRRHDRHPGIIVIDGSHSGAAAREVIAKAHRDGTAPVTYIGPRQRQRLRRAAEAAGFPRDVISWALLDPPACYAAGASRNLLTLATAGTPIITLDDDTSCSLRIFAWHEDGVAFIGHGDPRETMWFDSRQESTNAGQCVDVDLMGLHEAVLGQELRLLQNGGQSCCDMRRACRHLALAVQGACGARLRATWLGLAGDAAQYCPHWNLFASGATRELMATEENAFRLALSSREVARAVRRTTVTDEAALMMYCAGLDNSKMLPPFNPVGFNEDGLFGALLRLCDPSAYIAQIPVAVVHDSIRPSVYEPRAPRSASQVRLAEVIVRMLQSSAAGFVTQSPDERLRNIGRHLCAWSGLKPAEFAWQLKRVVLDLKWQLLNMCQSVVASGFDYPEYWRRELAEYREAACSSFADPGFYIPIEYGALSVLEERVEAVRRHVGMFGRLLLVWPDLWAWCARRKEWLNSRPS